jgi:hypothetical protein
LPPFRRADKNLFITSLGLAARVFSSAGMLQMASNAMTFLSAALQGPIKSSAGPRV